MRFYEIDMDEDQIRRLVKVVIDNYESSRHETGSYSEAVKAVQDSTLQSLENASDCPEWATENQGAWH